nr:immunoglobulin light chain junction region [Mus musculus]
CQHFWSTPPTF